MANFSALKTAIQNAIKQNGNEEITGDVLQQILLSVVKTMGDGAINTIEQNLSQETLARQNGDNTLQSNIDAEALARGNADTQLQNAINAIKANIDNGYVYAGIATPSSTPVSGKVFYIATAAGTYTDFGGQVLTQGINILRFNGSAWSSQQLIGIDDVPTVASNSLVKSGGVQNELALGAVYDVSAKNPTAGPNNDCKWESLSALLSDANLNTLIPTAYRKGGMSIKFVQSSDNKYVQFRLMKNQWSIDTNDWAVCDDEVIVESSEYVIALVDRTGRIIVAVEHDGNVFYGAGIPEQIVDYVNGQIENVNGDINAIRAFLTGFSQSDVLKNYLNDNYGQYVEDSEWAEVYVDKFSRIMRGSYKNGDHWINNLHSQTIDKLDEDVNVIKHQVDKQFAFSECITVRKLIPSYYFDYDSTPESIDENEYLDGVISAVPDGCKKVIFFTDSHWGIYNWTGKQGREYEGISTPIMLYCKNKLNIKNVIFGGDILAANMPQENALLWARRFMNNVLSAFHNSLLFVKGNHDFNQIQGENPQYDYTSLLNYTLTYPIYTKYLNDSVVFDEGLMATAKYAGYTGTALTEITCFAKQHYYKDDDDSKVRYIIVDTGSVNTNSYLHDLVGNDPFNVLWLQYAFIYSALMGTPKDYDVVVAGHFFLDYRNGFVIDTFDRIVTLCKMLSAFKVKGSVNVSYPSGISNLAYAGNKFNFRSRNNIGKVFVLCGDSHQDASAICQTNNGIYECVPYYDNVQQSDDAILIINTMCEVCGGVQQKTGGNATSYYPMTQGTITETAFDIIAWDSEHIYCKRVGDGVDRTFNY